LKAEISPKKDGHAFSDIKVMEKKNHESGNGEPAIYSRRTEGDSR